MKGMVGGPGSSTGVWKASKHKVVAELSGLDFFGGDYYVDYVEVAPDALWTRTDPFQTYRPAGDREPWAEAPKSLPHQTFRALADMAPERSASGEEVRSFNRKVEVFADVYGLLGLLREDLGTPLLPGSEWRIVVLVAPDAMIDETGKLQDIDPATDGKRLLEELIFEHETRAYSERGERHMQKPEKLDLSRSELVWPEELRFQKSAMDFSRPALTWMFFEQNRERVFTYEDARERYGVRVVFDRQADAGVSLVSTREPVRKWRDELVSFVENTSWEELDRRLDGGIRPRAVPGKDRREAENWYCASLLKAIYLMRYLDLNSGTKMRKCQAPDCPEYFRVGPRSSLRKYCSGRCASRVSSAMYRERRRSDRA